MELKGILGVRETRGARKREGGKRPPFSDLLDLKKPGAQGGPG